MAWWDIDALEQSEDNLSLKKNEPDKPDPSEIGSLA
jgi:hypothetical protein